jgi:glucose-6-phosphate 1-dehydrogenase
VSELLKTRVVLGARGDMTGRLLLPALVRLAGSGDLPEGLKVLAFDRDGSDDDAYRDHASEKLDAHLPDCDDKAADALLERLSYRGIVAVVVVVAACYRLRGGWFKAGRN